MVVPTLNDGTDPGSRACVPGRTALARIEQLSQRLEEHAEEDDEKLIAVRDEIHEVRGDVREINVKLGDMRVDMAKTLATVNNMSSAMTEQQEIKRVRMISAIETNKAEKIAEIDDERDRKKAKRALWLKIGLVLLGLVSTGAGMFIEHYR